MQRNNCTGIVLIVALNPEGRLILNEQYRVPVGKAVIEFPAGLVNDEGQSETPAEAARRELLEETGYQASKMVELIHGPVSSGSSSDMIFIYQAMGLKKRGRGGGDSNESIKVHEVALDQVPRWLKKMQAAGRLVDPKVYAGIYLLEKKSKTNRGTADKRARP